MGGEHRHLEGWGWGQQDCGDMGQATVNALQMNISLKDNEPVSRTYQSVTKPLYQEMKGYLQDLIAQGWVEKSTSSYSSPVVCVRKKDGTLRLCIDYRELNRKTHPDHHPTEYRTLWTVWA